MSLFKDMLGSDQTLFRNPVALDYDFIPKLIKYRENEQFNIASCIKPLFQDRNGKNLFIFGKPGVGKTVACRKVLEELEEQTDEIYPLYINCWQRDTSYKMLLDLCNQLGYKLTFNKKTDQLFAEVKKIINKKSAVFIFDELDKAKEFDFLYMILEEIYKKTIILITNFKEVIINLDDRLKSRLTAETVQFDSYNEKEIKGILKERVKYAFYPGVFDDSLFETIVKQTSEVGDTRIGLYILKESANLAEEDALKKVSKKHVESAIAKLSDFKSKNAGELDDDCKDLLAIIKAHSGEKIGDLYNLYQEKGGIINYKSFQRKIKKLADNKFITVGKIMGGKEGTTSIISFSSTKKLTEF